MQFHISQDFHNVRLDRFVRRHFSDIHLSSIFRLIRKGRIRVNGRKQLPGYHLREGDTVLVKVGSGLSRPLPPVSISADERQLLAGIIVYEDADILLCNKPSGTVLHRGSKHPYGLTEMIRAYTGNPDFTFVHRIDRATSGLVAGAKNLPAARTLSKLIRERQIRKYYTALVEGVVKNDKFTMKSFVRKEHDRVVVLDNDCDGAKEARTQCTVLQRKGNSTLIEAQIHTGRTHQIRVQLADIGHPVMGDAKYGRGGERMLLFAHRLVLPCFAVDFSLPLPDFFHTSPGDR